MAFASKLLAFGARLPRALESAVVQLPSLLEPPAAHTAAEHAAARTTHDLAQLAQLVYTPLAEQPLAGRQPFGLTIDDGSCNLWEIVLCTDALSHLDPITGRVLAVPALCIFRSPQGLALSFRGTKNVDEARVDAYGMSWLEDAPKFGGGVAAVHGGFWRSWSDTGAANLVRGVLEAEARSEAAVAAAEGLEAREPLRLLITGHSLGAAVATVAAHDLALAMTNGSHTLRGPSDHIDLAVPQGAEGRIHMDRVWLREDMRSYGQRAQEFQVFASEDGGATFSRIGNGTSIARKRIVLLDSPIAIDILRFQVTKALEWPLVIQEAAAFKQRTEDVM